MKQGQDVWYVRLATQQGIGNAETFVSAEKDNENAVNLLIADAFRIPGAMDRYRRERRGQLEPVISRGWAALEELPM